MVLSDQTDLSEARFMESYESRHSDQDFTSKLAHKLGVAKAPLRLDSQTKYGKVSCLWLIAFEALSHIALSSKALQSQASCLVRKRDTRKQIGILFQLYLHYCIRDNLNLWH